MAKILIIHPEGNIKNNPNLYALAKLIVEQGWEVLVYSRKRLEIYQGDIFEGARFVYFGDTIKETMRIEQAFATEDIRFVIGVDDFGIYKAQQIACFLKVKYLFLSYEILFDAEINKVGCKADRRNKKLAKRAVKSAVCAIVQDEVRKRLLSKEYGVDEKKILLMPVANAGSKHICPSNYFHDKFQIPSEMRVLLYMGWMDEKQERRLMSFAEYLPEEWVIVAHSRYVYKPISENPNIGSKIFFSCDKPIENMDEMGIILSDCHAGFCTYEPCYDSIYTGDNIKYIGMSSGKTTTFLQYGVPVVVENMNIWDNLVENVGIGLVLRDVNDLLKLNLISTDECRSRAMAYFENNLDAKLFFGDIWRSVVEEQRESSYSSFTFGLYKVKVILHERFSVFGKRIKRRLKLV